MKALLLVLLGIIGCCFANEAVLTLTESNFDSVVNNADIILVEFYAPWCGHCKHLAPEFEKAAQQLLKEDPPIPLAKVDATEEEALGQRFAIQGYPTLKVFRKGKDSEYQGTREAAGIVSYMKSIAGPAVRPIDSDDKLKALKEKNEILVVSFTDDKKAEFEEVAESLRSDFSFGSVSNANVRTASGFNGKIVLFRRPDGASIEYNGKTSLETFVNSNSLPIGGEITAKNLARYKKTGLPLLITYIDVDYDLNAKRTQYYQRRLVKLGGEYADRLIFAIANKNDFVTKDTAAFGVPITETVPEAVTIIEDTADKKYLFSDLKKPFNVENVKAFADAFLAGKLQANVKSERIPTAQKDDDATVVVGKTFDDVVLDDSKNVLIEFYAPWCGHCKTLEPKYKLLAQEFKGDEDVVIAKMDATANDWPKSKFEVKGFPTIYFKPKGKGAAIVQYSGAREVDAMKNFVQQNSK